MISRPYIFVIVAIIITAGVGGFFVFNPFNGGSSAPSCTNPLGKTVYFTIYESDRGAMEGMNGSYVQFYNGVYVWPIIKVQCNDKVTIHVVNVNSTEDHGFAIIHYFNSGVALAPGQYHNVTFIANDIGNFTIFCMIECSIHPFMQNGRLIVTP